MKKYFKLFSIFVCAMIIACILLSSCAVFVWHNHICTSDDCPVCQAVAALKNSAALIFVCCCAVTFLEFVFALLNKAAEKVFCGLTPVILKVKLSN